MKISLVLEDIGAGPQIIFSGNNPDEAIKFYKARQTPGKLAVVINPTIDRSRKIKAVIGTIEVPKEQTPKVEAKSARKQLL